MLESPSTTAQPDPLPSLKSETSRRFRRLRAPSSSMTAMIDPPLTEAECLIKSNLALAEGRNQASASLLRRGVHLDDDLDWTALRTAARKQLVADAIRYTRRYRDVRVPTDPATPVVMAGHQPSLFHPGVWMKNHTLSHLADQCGGIPINLVVDNDVCIQNSIRVPVIDDFGRARHQRIPFAQVSGSVPYEQTVLGEDEALDSFDTRVTAAIAPLVSDPLVTPLWRHVREAKARCGIAGCALAQARHALEAELGWQTLEIPVGVAVRGYPFARFVVGIMRSIETFVATYNQATQEYRAWHGIRSSAHPVPNLNREGDWWEMPLWLYGNDDPQRRAVWLRRLGDRWQLSDRHARHIELPANDAEAAAMQIAEAGSPQWKLRPRALMTTMFARLVLSDLFLHGIGGGKYDQLADEIVRQFFGIQPPAFQVVSATIRLPGTKIDPNRGQMIAQKQRQIRETIYQGERFLPENDPTAQQKRDLLSRMPSQGQRGDWHDQMTQVNQQIADQLTPLRHRWQRELDDLRVAAGREAILSSREHSFVLFPLDFLRTAFDSIQPSG